MKVNRYDFNLLIFYLVIIAFFSYLVATRQLAANTDAIVYRNYFLNLDYYNSGDRTFELGYHYFNYVVFKLSDNYELFLFTFYFVFNIIYIKSLSNFISYKGKSFRLFGYFTFLSLILLSSWYQTATLNGLRQGFSLSLLYLSLSYLFLQSKPKFILFLTLSCLFHSSTLLILPFLFLLKTKLRDIFLIFLIASVFYYLGVSEYLIRIFSNLIGLPLYEEISSYSEDNQLWKGFQLSFFVYSFFWCCFFLIIHHRYLIKSKSSVFLLKTMFLLTITYFVLGFGSFSNRFGFIAWLFLPIIQTFYLVSLSSLYIKDKNTVFLIVLFILFLGVFNYYLILRPI